MSESKKVVMSALPKTWLLDLDGTIVKHNGYKIDGVDTLLLGAKDFFDNIADDDMVIFVTSRTEEFKEQTEQFLKDNDIRYDYIIYGAPYGERILVNDCKPSGLVTAIALSPQRDAFLEEVFEVDETL